ncbi:Ras-related protein [Vairimorpha necatrix]|uniref:Ras-related protein n=1 Tax=Vairimorpha necatrix TaxID=6039 RepID=A0AAX4JA56_9MICR
MKNTYKTVFIGNSSVGKTTIMSQYLYQKIEDSFGPTIGLDFVSTTINILGRQVRLQLWDTAGQERFNSLIPNYTRNSFITIIVYDYSDEESYNKIDYWINDLVKVTDPENKIKLIIVANKKDLVEKSKIEEVRKKGKKKAKKFNALFVETCGLNYEDITGLVKAIHNLIEEDIKKNPEEEDSYKEIINLEKQKESRCCGGFRN